MLTPPLKMRGTRENEGQERAYHSERESLMINSSRNPEVSGKLDAECTEATSKCTTNTSSSLETRNIDDKFVSSFEVSRKPDAVFSFHNESSQNMFSRRDQSNEPGNRFESGSHSVFKFSDLAKVGKHILMGTRVF